jgi:hypothetical protein
MMNLTDLKLYCLNASAFTISLTDWLEPTLKLTLLVVTIGYTAHKWYAFRKDRNEGSNG